MNFKTTLFLSFILPTTLICMEQEVKKTHVTFEQVDQMCIQIHEKIKESGFTPELLVTMPRGGLVPTGILAGERMLDNRNMRTIAVSSYDFMQQGEVKLNAIFRVEDFEGFKSILLVDDLVDSGKTVEFVLELLKKELPKDVVFKVATLFYKPQSTVIPDYYVAETEDWIVFPWEK